MYATEGDLARVVGGFRRLLDEGSEAYELAVAADRGELYEELPQQWRCQYPGADPGERGVYEVRVGLARTSRARMDEVREGLTRVICPDPEHASPCPVPWAAGYTAGRCDVSL